MKKFLILPLCALVLTACKTEIEKDVSLSALINEPLRTETALLNVEISSCSSHEDSRKPSDSLIKIQQKIPNVFPSAKYKECYSKNYNSFASFEIPIGIGAVDDNTEFENDINVYSYKNRQLNVRTSEKLSKNIRNFLKSEYISNLEFNVVFSLTNDMNEDKSFNVYSAYIDDSPLSFYTVSLKKGQTYKVKLSNASSDMLWMYDSDITTPVLSSPFNMDDAIADKNKQ